MTMRRRGRFKKLSYPRRHLNGRY
ncbi:hypothetical protein E2C01_087599 [Portunus trituberculatus]|uniref:Uncharacterized protein n=1 Tax=Portunus trituberculatus TaxID=210409 RepID=A0A5B7JGT8_PORTR|nr:hypothetical protein [Portunus trituberculatus]